MPARALPLLIAVLVLAGSCGIAATGPSDTPVVNPSPAEPGPPVGGPPVADPRCAPVRSVSAEPLGEIAPDCSGIDPEPFTTPPLPPAPRDPI
jgi:hypothetical protein